MCKIKQNKSRTQEHRWPDGVLLKVEYELAVFFSSVLETSNWQKHTMTGLLW